MGNILAPMTYAAVNVNDVVLLPDSFKEFRHIVKLAELGLNGIECNLDAGFDSKQNRKLIWNSGMKPNIPENPRNRDTSKPKQGRPRYYNVKSYKKRFAIERTFAWEGAYRSLVTRYDRKDGNYMGRKLLAYTLINLRHFCGKLQ
jgi:transposase